MKTFRNLAIVFLPTIAFSCNNKIISDVDPLEKPIVILYDNDVHCGNDAEGYAQTVGLKDAICAADTAQCVLVSSGDYLQGGVIGSLSKGYDMVTILNRCGYDAVCLGNHEFDYGMQRLFDLTALMNAPVTCCNMTRVNEEKPVYDRYIMVKTALGAKLAFVGILTPIAYTAEHAAFVDKDGNPLYEIKSDFSVYVQDAVNDARANGADYVIALSHLGEASDEWSSQKMIAATNGIDAVLDGHTHSVVEYTSYPNKDGKMVPVTQTGTKFENLGKLYISRRNGIQAHLIPVADISESSAVVKSVVDSIRKANSAKLDSVVGHTDYKLTIYDDSGNRIVRRQECNAGNFVADAFRYVGDGEIAITNGGSIRTDIPAGEIKIRQIIDLVPFGNEVVTFKIKGSDILKILQNGTEGSQDGKECGAFPNVSAMKYVIEKTGTERVKASKVFILESGSNTYSALDPERYYIVSSTAYFIKGLDYLKDVKIVKDGLGVEYEAVSRYLKEALSGSVGEEYQSVQGRITFE